MQPTFTSLIRSATAKILTATMLVMAMSFSGLNVARASVAEHYPNYELVGLFVIHNEAAESAHVETANLLQVNYDTAFIIVMNHSLSGEYKFIACVPNPYDAQATNDAACMQPLPIDTPIQQMTMTAFCNLLEHKFVEVCGLLSSSSSSSSSSPADLVDPSEYLTLPLLGTALASGWAPSTIRTPLNPWTTVLIISLLMLSASLVPEIFEDPEEFYRVVGSVGVPEYDEVPLSRDERYAQLVKELRHQRRQAKAEEAASVDSDDEATESTP